MLFYLELDSLILDLQDGSDSTKIDCSDMDLVVDDKGIIHICTNVKETADEINA